MYFRILLKQKDFKIVNGFFDSIGSEFISLFVVESDKEETVNKVIYKIEMFRDEQLTMINWYRSTYNLDIFISDLLRNCLTE